MPSDPNKILFQPRYQPCTRRNWPKRKMNVTLTNKELELCNFLILVTQFLKENYPELPIVELRIAGGWVRDKLLGYECNDLDIAINSMMGYEFGEHVNNCLRRNKYATESIHKIELNPDKSKHLETAATKIFGYEIDFVNLRSEEYAEDSRIPSKVVKYHFYGLTIIIHNLSKAIQNLFFNARTFGTPEQDAYRRDLTINALFYNIHTRQVEDPTKKGIHDLENGLIRTPLEPFETFNDDPLRVLRCIRLASKFNFLIDESIWIAVKDERIKKAISTKVSRERIGIEMNKMLKGPHPALSIRLIYELGLYDTIFAPPQDYHEFLDDSKTAVCLARILEWLLSTSNENHLHTYLSSRTPEDIRLLYLATFLAPHKTIKILTKKRNYTSFHHVIKESLKMRSSDGDITNKLFSFVDQITTAASRNLVAPLDRKSLGHLIRDIGSQWQNAFILALICELLPKLIDIESGNLEESYKIIEKYNKLVDLIIELGIQNCFNDKPILNGNDIATLLNIKKGTIIGEIQKSVIEWQLENPGGSKKQCEDYIKNKYNNL